MCIAQFSQALPAMKFRQVEAFRHVMLHGSLTRAADAMALSQPAVSHLVVSLEEWLGFSLFERRTGHALTPTAEAHALFAEVSRAFVGLEELTRSAREIGSLRGGHIRIAAPAFIANSILCHAAGRFLGDYPDASVSIDIKPHQDIVSAVMNRVMDYGLVVLPVVGPNLAIIDIGRFELLCAVPRSHRLASMEAIRPQDLGAERIIKNTNGTQIDLGVERLLQSAQVSVRKNIVVRNQEIACGLVCRNVGVALLASPLPAHIAHYPGVCFRPFAPAASIELGLISTALRTGSALEARFVAQIEHSAAAFARGDADVDLWPAAARHDGVNAA